jgi:GDP-D-mannose dehydratase
VRVSFDTPEYTGNVTGLGTTRLLEMIRRSGNGMKFYQASSSEMFGATPPPQKEIYAILAAEPVCLRQDVCLLDDAELP